LNAIYIYLKYFKYIQYSACTTQRTLPQVER
jgi:hypothetical protein